MGTIATLIHKSGKISRVENYRPVSVTSTCYKQMEKIIRNAIVKHLEMNNILSPYQHGFRKGKSCITQLLEIMEEWTKAIVITGKLILSILTSKLRSRMFHISTY